MVSKKFKANANKIVDGRNNKANETIVNLSNKSKNNKSRKLTHMPNIGAIEKPTFFTLNVKKALSHLK